MNPTLPDQSGTGNLGRIRLSSRAIRAIRAIRVLGGVAGRVLAWAAVAALLLLTFDLYTQPDFLLKLSNQIWLCF